MEILKFILIGLGTIIALVLIVPLFTRKDISVLDGMLGKDLADGLTSLKAILEK